MSTSTSLTITTTTTTTVTTSSSSWPIEFTPDPSLCDHTTHIHTHTLTPWPWSTVCEKESIFLRYVTSQWTQTCYPIPKISFLFVQKVIFTVSFERSIKFITKPNSGHWRENCLLQMSVVPRPSFSALQRHVFVLTISPISKNTVDSLTTCRARSLTLSYFVAFIQVFKVVKKRGSKSSTTFRTVISWSFMCRRFHHHHHRFISHHFRYTHCRFAMHCLPCISCKVFLNLRVCSNPLFSYPTIFYSLSLDRSFSFAHSPPPSLSCSSSLYLCVRL